MLRFLPALALLGALAAPAGSAKMCPACSEPQNCTDFACASAQDSCLFSQMRLENGTVFESGSCVPSGQCSAGVYALTYGPHSSLWLSTACCENCSSAPQREAVPNAVECPYCAGNGSAPCDTLSVMNCTGDQTVCVTLNGTWSKGGPQILRGCATPEVCHLRVNDTLGPYEFGFHLNTEPDCNYLALPTQPGPNATVAPTNRRATTCFTCSDLYHCDPLPCPEDRSYCLQTAGVIALGRGNSTAWRNGSCVASEDCKLDTSISALTYSASFGFWVNTTCCQGNCQEPPPLATRPASHTFSKFLCPTCPVGRQGFCDSSLYMQCPSGETQCVQLNLIPEEGGRNLSVRGCGSVALCRAATRGSLALPGLRLARPPACSARRRAVLGTQCRSAAPRLRLLLPALLPLALGAAALS